MLPTARSLKYLRGGGYMAAVVEKWNAHVMIRQDLFGFGDILAVNEFETLLIQATSDNGGNVSARVRKALQLKDLLRWLRGPARRFEVWGWRRRLDGWEVRRVEITADDIDPREVMPRPHARRRKGRQPELFE